MLLNELYGQTLRHFFAPIVPLLDDNTITEILINGHQEIVIERSGVLSTTTIQFDDEDQLLVAIRHLAQFVGRHVDAQQPILEARFPDGSRVEAILPPAAPDGPHVAIRRFFSEALTMSQLLAWEALDEEAANLLVELIGERTNIIVSGGTSSGKTSVLNVLSKYVGETERVVVIEDARELQMQCNHTVYLEAQAADSKGRGRVTIRDLLKATLRMRPDRIVVGEIRGEEALELIQAMTSGHSGCMSTVHATAPREALFRLETMALMSDVELPLHALRSQLALAVGVIVQTAHFHNGRRGVTHITEVRDVDESGALRLVDLYASKIFGNCRESQVAGSSNPIGDGKPGLDRANGGYVIESEITS